MAEIIVSIWLWLDALAAQYEAFRGQSDGFGCVTG
jgi:hypothetical protein